MPVGHEGVCVLVGSGTKKFHRNSEKGTDIGMHFVIFTCLTSKSNGLTRSRGRPSGKGKGKGRWAGLSSSGIPNTVTQLAVITARGVGRPLNLIPEA